MEPITIKKAKRLYPFATFFLFNWSFTITFSLFFSIFFFIFLFLKKLSKLVQQFCSYKSIYATNILSLEKTPTASQNTEQYTIGNDNVPEG